MKELYPLFGVVAIPQTLFDVRDRVDFGSFSRGVADRLAAGVNGLLYPVVGTTGRRSATPAKMPWRTASIDEAVALHAEIGWHPG